MLNLLYKIYFISKCLILKRPISKRSRSKNFNINIKALDNKNFYKYTFYEYKRKAVND